MIFLVYYSKIDSEGAQKKPSIIINRLLKLFGDGIKINAYKEQCFITKQRFKNAFARDIFKFYSQRK